jgi:hypothetical protein
VLSYYFNSSYLANLLLASYYGRVVVAARFSVLLLIILLAMGGRYFTWSNALRWLIVN